MKAHRALIIEDDALLGTYLVETLTGMGYEICAIESTEAAAVSAAGRHRPDLMIVDARLRDGSGISAVRAILGSGFVPHVFISGDTASVQASTPTAIVLQKPFRESDLVQAVHRALAASAAGSE